MKKSDQDIRTSTKSENTHKSWKGDSELTFKTTQWD